MRTFNKIMKRILKEVSPFLFKLRNHLSITINKF